MGNKTLYDELKADPVEYRMMAEADLITEATEELCSAMETENVNRTKLASLMGTTRGYISQLLCGSRNFTLKTLADIAYHLGYEVKLTLVKRGERQ